MDITTKLDDLGMPAWIGLMVLAFILFWPAGLAVLAYLMWSGRMGHWTRNTQGTQRGWGRWQCGRAWTRRQMPSGNSAFDEYREETLRRLEEEQKEFQDFLDQLRRARDKAEFDQFMAKRRRRPGDAAEPADMPEAQPQS